MFKQFKLVCLTAFGIIVGFSASAADKAPGSGPNPFSDCGIGAALFTDIKWAAVTSNVIWDLGTTAVTSATASPETCSGNRLAAAIFIKDTYDLLAEETAKGKGEHLTAALNLFECAVVHQDEAAVLIRNEMAAFVATSGYSEKSTLDKAAGFYSIVDAATASSCT
jgi:hypothetical protein